MFTAKKPLAAAACVLALLFPGAGCLGETRDQFSDGSFEETVVIPQGGGSNSSVAFDLPRNVSVTGASLDIEGRQADYGLTTTVLDFQKPLGSTAWAGTAAGAPPVLPPSSYESTNITLVPGIRKSDDIRYTTSKLNNLPYHLIEFYVGRDLLVNFNLSWEGIGFSDPQMGVGRNGADLYLWDSSRLSWKAMDSEGMGEVPVEVTLGARVLVNAGDYVDLEGRINALVCPAWMYSNRVETDYVKLDFTGISHGRPFNVTLDVGADNTTDWSHPGLFQDNETFSGPAFVQALQACLDNASTDPVRIPLKFTSDGGGVLFLSNLSIEHSPKDLPPFLKKAVPSLALEEDGRLFGALDISEHFGDDGGSAKLEFSVAWMDDPGKAGLVVNGTRLDLFANLTDWYGQVTARLRSTDAKGQWADSNNFSVRVTPVDDPPRLERQRDGAFMTS